MNCDWLWPCQVTRTQEMYFAEKSLINYFYKPVEYKHKCGQKKHIVYVKVKTRVKVWFQKAAIYLNLLKRNYIVCCQRQPYLSVVKMTLKTDELCKLHANNELLWNQSLDVLCCQCL